jgi:uncharacterized membrane protein
LHCSKQVPESAAWTTPDPDQNWAINVSEGSTAVHNRKLQSIERHPLDRYLFAIIALAVVGLGLSGYLTYTHFNEAALVCSVGGCETVQSSSYSTIGPVPIAMLGMGMFSTLIVLAGFRLRRSSFISAETASLAAWAMLLAGILYYAYLTYVELFVLNAICQWCVASSIAALAIFGLESVYFWRTALSEDVLESG